jgi:tRNA dimethylallyltransferase
VISYIAPAARVPANEPSAPPLPVPTLVLVGPTAVGKSAVVAALAGRRPLEVVVADSLQVYRGLDIGTAKPTAAERARIPHHLVDVLEPTEPFSAVEFAARARAALAGSAARGHLPVVAGGTGLYVRALLRGPLGGPAGDAALRARLYADAAAEGRGALHARLAAVDPTTAAAIHPHNLVRVLRALELYHLTGCSPSALRTGLAEGPPPGVVLVGLRRAKDDLAGRIAARTRAMLDAGLVEEVRGLVARGVPREAKPMGAIGYREILDHLAGRCSLPEAAVRIDRATRLYAKRQMTWFRREPGLIWVDLRPGADPAAVAAILETLLDRRPAEGDRRPVALGA